MTQVQTLEIFSVWYVFDNLICYPRITISIIKLLHRFKYERYFIFGKPWIVCWVLILEHSTNTKVLKFFIFQIGAPSINLLSLIERFIKLQLAATTLRLSSVISSHPSIKSVFIKVLLAKIGISFFSSILTSKWNEIYVE